MNITALVKSQLKDGSDWLKMKSKSNLANMFFFFFSKMLYAYLNLISPLLLRVFGIPRWGWQMELLTGRSNLNEIWHANTDSILNNSFSSSSFFSYSNIFQFQILVQTCEIIIPCRKKNIVWAIKSNDNTTTIVTKLSSLLIKQGSFYFCTSHVCVFSKIL